jgi:hypothetical protein
VLLKKSAEDTGPEWFRKLYLLLAGEGLSNYMVNKYVRHAAIILTAEGKLVHAWEAVLPTIDPDVGGILEYAKEPEKSHYLHPAILAGASESEREQIVNFLHHSLGAKTSDYQTIVEEKVLPQMHSDAVPPAKELLLELTRLVRKAFDKGLRFYREIHVVTQSGSIKPARQVFFSSKYNPKWDWETNRQYVPALDFLSEEYLGGTTDFGESQSWYEFFKSAGVQDDKPDGIVQEFAENYSVSEDIRDRFEAEPKPVGKHKIGAPGYDFEIEKKGEPPIGIEVKGLTEDRDIELPSNETETAKQYKERYYLYIVSSIPKNPELHIVKNPFEYGKTDKLTASQVTWKKFKVPL